MGKGCKSSPVRLSNEPSARWTLSLIYQPVMPRLSIAFEVFMNVLTFKMTWIRCGSDNVMANETFI